MVAVCSVDKDEVLEQLGVRTTTNPIQLALWAGSGPIVVFATYASPVEREDPSDITGRRRIPGPLEAALAGGKLLYGQRLAGFGLAVLDEGHMTAGDIGRPRAAIHDNSRIPVDFRLYLTATPRILASPRPQRERDSQEPVIASMEEDSLTYGPRIFDLGLAEAVERSILAGFEIDVLEIRETRSWGCRRTRCAAGTWPFSRQRCWSTSRVRDMTDANTPATSTGCDRREAAEAASQRLRRCRSCGLHRPRGAA